MNSLQTYGTPVHLLGKSGISSLQSMEKLLWEAQKESNHSSAVGSGRNSHSISPKSAQSPLFPLESISPVESLLLNKVLIAFYHIMNIDVNIIILIIINYRMIY